MDPAEATQRVTSLVRDKCLSGTYSRVQLTDSFARGHQQWRVLCDRSPLEDTNEDVMQPEGRLRRSNSRAQFARRVVHTNAVISLGVQPAETSNEL